MQSKINILIPAYNDWDALTLLLDRIEATTNHLPYQIVCTVVNDGSNLEYPSEKFRKYKIEVIHLMRNVGHQKAIAIGLAHLADKGGYDKVIVMDADGEDRPEDIEKLVAASEKEPNKIVFAQRQKRSEGFIFRTFYIIYRFIFDMLTGKSITFGNFCLIPQSKVKNIAFVSEIWNNFPGGVIRSKLPYTSVPIVRGTRLAGKSQMNFVSLVLHGMSTISVFLDATAVRIMLFSILMIIFSSLGIFAVIYFKFVVEIATPGWASSLASGFFIIMLQGFFISLFMVFTVLSYRSNKHFIPLLDYKPFIERIENRQET